MIILNGNVDLKLRPYSYLYVLSEVKCCCFFFFFWLARHLSNP